MFNTFITSFKLESTYKTNSLICSLKQLPIIGKLLPNKLYGNKDIKLFFMIIATLREFWSIFAWKILYVLLMIYLPATLFKLDSSVTFVHIFFFLTIIGGLNNTNMFNPSKDKYYAITLMKMDAKKYAVANYIYYLVKTFVGFIPALIIFGLISKVNIFICLLMIAIVILIKVVLCMIYLFYSKKKNKVINENLPAKFVNVMVVILLLLAYLLPYLGIVVNSISIFAIFLLLLLPFIYGIKYIKNYDRYGIMYKTLLKPNVIIFNNKDFKKNNNEDIYMKAINITNEKESKKIGYDYFNDIFVKRHRKILTKSAKIMGFGTLIVFLVLIVVALFIPDSKIEINKLPLMSLPYFLFIMYILNRGTVITQAMFLNCDHSMLTYRFYRQSKSILELFKRRLFVLIKINLIPSIVISLGLPLLLFVSGGTSNYLNYLVLFISILSMSIFFSVHYLVMYYLLQPYNVDMETKSSTYTVVSSITYFVCYFFMQMKIPTLIFGTCMTLFAVIYILVSLFLAYKYAPSTFKLK